MGGGVLHRNRCTLPNLLLLARAKAVYGLGAHTECQLEDGEAARLCTVRVWADIQCDRASAQLLAEDPTLSVARV